MIILPLDPVTKQSKFDLSSNLKNLLLNYLGLYALIIFFRMIGNR